MSYIILYNQNCGYGDTFFSCHIYNHFVASFYTFVIEIFFFLSRVSIFYFYKLVYSKWILKKKVMKELRYFNQIFWLKFLRIWKKKFHHLFKLFYSFNVFSITKVSKSLKYSFKSFINLRNFNKKLKMKD